jgi:anthranilate phosphoribosyltransferase
MVVHGAPGIDELSPLGPSIVIEVRDGNIIESTIEPGLLGLTADNAHDLAPGEPSENAAVIEAVLAGKGTSGATNAVLLNAAAAIYVGGKSATFRAGIDAARESIKSGGAVASLEALRRATKA